MENNTILHKSPCPKCGHSGRSLEDGYCEEFMEPSGRCGCYCTSEAVSDSARCGFATNRRGPCALPPGHAGYHDDDPITDQSDWTLDERPADPDNPCSVCGLRMPINVFTGIFGAHHTCIEKAEQQGLSPQEIEVLLETCRRGNDPALTRVAAATIVHDYLRKLSEFCAH